MLAQELSDDISMYQTVVDETVVTVQLIPKIIRATVAAEFCPMNSHTEQMH